MIPAPKPAATVPGPEMEPSEEERRVLYVSNATKPGREVRRDARGSLGSDATHVCQL